MNAFVQGQISALKTGLNQSELSNFNLALEVELAKAKNDNTYKSNILCIGDSVIEGANAGSTNKSYVGLFNAALQTRQYGSAADEYNFYPEEVRLANPTVGSFTGTWVEVNNVYSAVGTGVAVPEVLGGKPRGWSKTTQNGATITIHSLGYKIKLLFASDGVFAEPAGSISYTVNGGTATVVDLAGSTHYKWVEIDPGGAYDIVITASLTAGEAIGLQAIEYLTNLTGVKCVNLATGGSGAYHWAARTNIIDAFAPKLTLIEVGANDQVQGRTVAQYEADYRAIITKCKTHGDVAILHYAAWNTADAELLAKVPLFKAVVEKLVEEFNLAYVDFHKVFISGPIANAKGLLSDEIHPNAAGHELAYRYLKTIVRV